LAEWRAHRGLSQDGLGERLNPPVAGMTVSRWETGVSRMSDQVMAAVAEALDAEPQDLYRHPKTESADALMREAPDDLRDAAMRAVAAIIGRRG